MDKKSPSILILTGSFGDGHNTAARNLKAAFESLLGPDATVEVVDFVAFSLPKTSVWLQKGYLFAINHMPFIWRQLYRMADFGGSGYISKVTLNRQLKVFLEERKPAAVVSTFPVYSVAMADLYPEGKDRSFPFYTVITDSLSINSMWAKGCSNLLFVTDKVSQRVVAEQGTALEKIVPLGFPISFRTESETVVGLQSPDEIPPRLLYLPTTRTGHVKASLEQIFKVCRQREIHLTIVMGRHGNRLRPLIEELGTGGLPGTLELHDWVSDVPALMRTHHLVVTKAGGATIHEALGMQCPVLINYVVPGQEEGNADLVLQEECGLRVEEPEELPKAIETILFDGHGELWKHFRSNLKRLDRSEAALRIAECVIKDAAIPQKHRSVHQRLLAEL